MSFCTRLSVFSWNASCFALSNWTSKMSDFRELNGQRLQLRNSFKKRSDRDMTVISVIQAKCRLAEFIRIFTEVDFRMLLQLRLQGISSISMCSHIKQNSIKSIRHLRGKLSTGHTSLQFCRTRKRCGFV